jgi:hypothetical protein
MDVPPAVFWSDYTPIAAGRYSIASRFTSADAAAPTAATRRRNPDFRGFFQPAASCTAGIDMLRNRAILAGFRGPPRLAPEIDKFPLKSKGLRRALTAGAKPAD